MRKYAPFLDQIADRQGEMVDLVRRLSAINSGSENLTGIDEMRRAVEEASSGLACETQRVEPRALLLSKRSNAPFQLLLCGHLDTVYGVDDPFQESEWIDEERLRGPGVADMKGGIVVALAALEALESSPFAESIGWRFLCTSDEEIGSQQSAPLIRSAAKGCQLALVYEPSLPDGALVSGRKGSTNYSLIAHGRSAHIGRNPEEGESAISKMVAALAEVEGLATESTLVNIGTIEGGEALNRVSAFCRAGINVRSTSAEEIESVDRALREIAKRWRVEVEVLSRRPPKPFDSRSEQLFQEIRLCGEEIGLSIEWRETGGVCDGNLLAAEGLAVCDTLGVRGEFLHSDQEMIFIESLVQRAQLSALLLMKLASGEIRWTL